MKIYFVCDGGKNQIDTLRKHGRSTRFISYDRLNDMKPETQKKCMERLLDVSPDKIDDD